MKNFAILSALTAVVFAGLFGTKLSLPAKPSQPVLPAEISLASEELILSRFATTLSFNTTSAGYAENHVLHPEQFHAMQAHMRKSWPKVFKELSLTKVADLSLLLKWEGSDTNLKPALFISHQDVVSAGIESLWTHPPFGGVITDGYVWGRGALDVKVTMTAMYEAVEHLLNRGFKPARTIYLAFGHDEECGGRFGAVEMAKLLDKQGIKLEFVFDEGGTVLVDGLKGIAELPLAMVGTAEKDTQDFTLEVKGTGGHSMSPPAPSLSVVTRLAKIISEIEAHQPAPRMVPPTNQLLKALAPVAKSKVLGFLLHNVDVWPFRSLLAHVLHKKGAELRATTISSHVINTLQTLPVGHNIVPSLASANINFRVLPGDTPADLLKGIQSIANKHSKGGSSVVTQVDRGARVKYSGARVASLENVGFRSMQQAALETLANGQGSGLVVAPYLMLGRTDSSHYIDLSDGQVFRFMPFKTNKTAGDLHRIHGIDERVSTESYLEGVKFYVRMIELSTSSAGSLHAN